MSNNKADRIIEENKQMRGEIEELRRIIKLKEEEIVSLKAGELANAFNPHIFLKNNIREEFWQKIVLT